jgi:predicted permease
VPVLALKLLALPAITAGVVFALGLWPWPGAMLIVASAGPTAVNTLLMAIEQNGDAELAADCVFWTTLLSAVTVTLVLGTVAALGGHPPGLPMMPGGGGAAR